MRYDLYRWVLGGWYGVNSYDSRADALAAAAPWVELGMRVKVVARKK